MIIGQPGSGKSTLARRLGKIFDLPVEHMDLIHWQTGWVECEGLEKDRLCAEVHSRDRWIFEGGRSNTWPERLERADTLIFLDFPLLIRSWRVLKRRVEYHNRSRPDMPDGCRENINWEFITFIWETRTTHRENMIAFFNSTPDEKEKYRLNNKVEVDSFVHSMGCESANRNNLKN